jgi:hypothetical protein
MRFTLKIIIKLFRDIKQNRTDSRRKIHAFVGKLPGLGDWDRPQSLSRQSPERIQRRTMSSGSAAVLLQSTTRRGPTADDPNPVVGAWRVHARK